MAHGDNDNVEAPKRGFVLMVLIALMMCDLVVGTTWSSFGSPSTSVLGLICGVATCLAGLILLIGATL